MERTKFAFENKLFAVPGTYIFGEGVERRPMLNVQLGDLDVALPLESVLREFRIEASSNDGKLLALAAGALSFVKVITPGDSIPNELLDGSASWPIEDHHLDIAKRRVTLGLSSWISGEPVRTNDPEKLQRLLVHPETKKQIQDGFERAVHELGLKSTDEVGPLLENLARELSYIFALREYYLWILSLPKNLKATQALLRNDRQSLETAIRVSQLIEPVMKDYKRQFLNIETSLHDIGSTLKDLKTSVQSIRQIRDALHKDTVVWSAMEPDWRAPELGSSKIMRKAVADLYSFVAQNFMESAAM